MCESGNIFGIVSGALILIASLVIAVFVVYEKSQYSKEDSKKEKPKPTGYIFYRNLSYVWLVMVVILGIIRVVIEANNHDDCSIVFYVLALLSFFVSCYSALVLSNLAQKNGSDLNNSVNNSETQTPAGYHGIPMRF